MIYFTTHGGGVSIDILTMLQPINHPMTRGYIVKLFKEDDEKHKPKIKKKKKRKKKEPLNSSSRQQFVVLLRLPWRVRRCSWLRMALRRLAQPFLTCFRGELGP
jgi:hypothetical protein